MVSKNAVGIGFVQATQLFDCVKLTFVKLGVKLVAKFPSLNMVPLFVVKLIGVLFTELKFDFKMVQNPESQGFTKEILMFADTDELVPTNAHPPEEVFATFKPAK